MPLNANLAELDHLLQSVALPKKSLTLFGLDGFFAALALTPEPILATQWLPWVWDAEQGTERPAFADSEQEHRLTELVRQHHATVLAAIKRGEFVPHLPDPDGAGDDTVKAAQVWCEGFVLGMTLSPAPWDKLLDRHSEMLSPMLLLGTEEGQKTLVQNPQGITALAVATALPGAVATLKTHFANQTGPLRLAKKVGRNDPCTCGSGKKFKKCCGTGNVKSA